MRLISKFKKQTKESFKGVASDIMQLAVMQDEIIERYNGLADDYARLKRHISNNGLWGVVKKLRAEFEELRGHTAVMITEHDRQLRELETNGVATAINRLNEEVFGKSKQTSSGLERVTLSMKGISPREEATLAAKVDAIIEHLGIEVNVEPEKVVKTPAKIVAKKVKKTTKKGRK